jgi:hypothetical protein
MKQILIVCGVVLFLVGAILFVRYVWPTKYSYDRIQLGGYEFPVRIDRFTGDAERLGNAGWQPLRPPRKSAEEILGISPAQDILGRPVDLFGNPISSPTPKR